MFSKTRHKRFLGLRKWSPQLRLKLITTPYAIHMPTANILAIIACYLFGVYGLSVLTLVPVCLVMLAYWRMKHEELESKTRLKAELRAQRERVLGDRENGESVEWVNFAMDRWWGCCMSTVNQFVKDWIEPIIDSFKLPVGVESIEVITFDTGPYRPVLSNVRLLEQTMTGADSFQPLPPSRLTTPPEPDKRKATMVFEVDLDINAPQSRFLLRTRLGNKKLGQNFVLNIESFRLKGCLRCFISGSADAPFPHLTTAKICFVKKPHVEATCKILKETIEVFDIPVLRDMVMQYIFTGFDKLLVYPEGITVDFSHSPIPTTEREKMTERGLAEGVLTVIISGSKQEVGGGKIMDEGRGESFCSLQLGSQHCQRRFGRGKESWDSSFSFLVHSLATQELTVKLKKKRRTMQSSAVASHKIQLSKLGLGADSEEDPAIRKVTVSGGGTQLLLTLHYSPLPTFSLTRSHPPLSGGEDAGVLYIHLHGAKNLIGPSSIGSCDLICSVCTGDLTLLTTQATPTSHHPIWEEGTELLVPNISNMKLRFEVATISNKPGSYDLLGFAHFNLSTGPTHIIQHRLSLSRPSDAPPHPSSSSLYVSLIFRPVDSMKHTMQHLITDFVSRTRRTSLASCLDTTTQLLNPHPHGPNHFKKSYLRRHSADPVLTSPGTDSCSNSFSYSMAEEPSLPYHHGDQQSVPAHSGYNRTSVIATSSYNDFSQWS